MVPDDGRTVPDNRELEPDIARTIPYPAKTPCDNARAVPANRKSDRAPAERFMAVDKRHLTMVG
jgi:hypothetical protein